VTLTTSFILTAIICSFELGIPKVLLYSHTIAVGQGKGQLLLSFARSVTLVF
jgi:hypothetical protein